LKKLQEKTGKFFKGEPSNFEEACLAKMPWQLYELFIKDIQKTMGCKSN